MSQAEIAQTFSVSRGTVENWWRSWRATRRTQPLPQAGGTPRTLQPYASQIRQAVQHQPDATLAELCAAVGATTHQHATASMMCRELHRLHLPKKSHCTIVSATPRVQRLRQSFRKKMQAPLRRASPPS